MLTDAAMGWWRRIAHRKPCPPRYVGLEQEHSEAAGHILRCWRQGGNAAWRAAAGAGRPDDDYAAAVATVAAELARYQTLDDLVAAYLAGLALPRCAAVCQRPSGRRLDAESVEAAAYWRRYQQLFQVAVTG